MSQEANLPVALLLGGRAVLVVGRGPELERRVIQFVEAGAVVRVVTRGTLEAARLANLQQIAGTAPLEICQREYEETDLDDRWVVVMSDRDAQLAESIARSAQERRVFFCAIDQPQFNSFAHVAITRHGSLSIAVSSAGAVPGLSGRLRDELARVLSESGMAGFTERVAALRRRIAPAERFAAVKELLRSLSFEGRLRLPVDDLDEAERRWLPTAEPRE